MKTTISSSALLDQSLDHLVGSLFSNYIEFKEVRPFVKRLAQMNKEKRPQSWKIPLRHRREEPVMSGVTVIPESNADGSGVRLHWLIHPWIDAG